MNARDEADRQSFPARFERTLTELSSADAVRRWLVAFSGGMDSSVLLHTVSRLSSGIPVVAVHIDHGLQSESVNWADKCRAVARSLGVAFELRSVQVDRAGDQGIEAAAREARYRALAELVGAGDVLLTAHHADDQLETVLLRLLRGSGVRGLTAVRHRMPFAEGLLLRPLLDFSRVEIEAEASRLQLDWAEDPSNADTRYDRNYLRAECLPALLQRWPRAGKLANRMAHRMAATESLLEELAALDLAGLGQDQPDVQSADHACRLPLDGLRRLSPARQDNLIRHVIRQCGLATPGVVHLGELRRALDAREDAQTRVSWPGVEARVYRQQLYLGRPATAAEQKPGRIAIGDRLAVGNTTLELQRDPSSGIPDAWARDGLCVRFRQGGERIRPRREGGSKPLKQWFQEQGIVPWQRASVPLLFHADELVAVADLWISDNLPREAKDAPFWRPVWTGHSRLF